MPDRLPDIPEVPRAKGSRSWMLAFFSALLVSAVAAVLLAAVLGTTARRIQAQGNGTATAPSTSSGVPSCENIKLSVNIETSGEGTFATWNWTAENCEEGGTPQVYAVIGGVDSRVWFTSENIWSDEQP